VSNGITEISDYIGSRKQTNVRNSNPVDSRVDQNEPPVPIGSHTQPREPIVLVDGNRIASLVLRAVFVGLGNTEENW
jgi:hypothetical protein